TKKKIVRATGHLSPRSASFLSARRYQTAKKIATATHSQLNRHSVIHRIAVSSGGNSYLVVIRAGDASGGISSGFGGSELSDRVAVRMRRTMLTNSPEIN